MARYTTLLEDNPLWYCEAVIYQLHIKAFFDTDGNGIGDFRGLLEKLDYLQELGVTAIWLLPFYPSPLRDDGYDIADYLSVNPNYNTLRDFREFLRAAHSRGIRVITELVLNHTSDQHPWFQRARRAKPGSVYRDFYVWSDTPEKYHGTRIIFQDFETSNWTWDPVAKAYYWHRFYSHQPDLNFDNPRVQDELLRAIDFWLKMGVDGLRLDAVPYLYEREGTNCENLPETHDFLRKLRAHVDGKFKNRMLLAEANQWPEDAVEYFGDGNECHMTFHFPLMPRMFMAMEMEDRFPIVDILDQTPAIPEGSQWAIFLRNHDELTLEMVTDEERDYMYRVYANDPRARINLGIRRRLAPLMRNNRRKIELMNILLFSLPGTPIIYYGDEIGMGDNYYLGDRDGVRTPMQWSPDRNAGFSRANPQKLFLPVIIEPEYHYESVNVENQERNPSSLLWWMRRVIAMRKRFRAFGRGTLEMLLPDNPKVLAFVRSHGDETILVVVNLSRFSQVVHIDLARYAGMVPEDIFSRNRFPLIGEEPYLLTLGVHDYYWFQLCPAEDVQASRGEVPRLKLRPDQPWQQILAGRIGSRFLEGVIPGYLRRSRWFRGKARTISQAALVDQFELQHGGRLCVILLVRVTYTEGVPEIYLIPLTCLSGDKASALVERSPGAVVATLQVGDDQQSLVDAIFVDEFQQGIFQMFHTRKKLRGTKGGELDAFAAGAFRRLSDGLNDPVISRILKSEQSNNAILYGDRLFLKLYRQVEAGVNPDLELTRYLTEQAALAGVPTYAGGVEYRDEAGESYSLGLLQGFVPNQGDGWHFTLDLLSQYLEGVLAARGELPPLPPVLPTLMEAATQPVPPELAELFGGFHLEMVDLLGRRTAEMHLALAGNEIDPDWRLEEFSTLYQRSVYQSMRSLVRRNFALLARQSGKLPEAERKKAEQVLALEKEVLGRIALITGHRIQAMKSRIHGDYHLGQVLFTGKDFVIIDFEGEPARTLSERRLKRSPLRDVAGMIRSFHYGAMTVLFHHARNHPGDVAFLNPWLEAWYIHMSGAFLRAWRQRLGDAPLVPADQRDFETLLHSFLLDKAVYELGYELNNRPEWVALPLRGIEMTLQEYRS